MPSSRAVLGLAVLAGLGLVALSQRPSASTPPAPAPEPAAEVLAVEPKALPASYAVELEGAAEAPPARRRIVSVDLVPVIGRRQRVDVVYDLEAVTRPTTLADLREAADWEAGVRLLLGEMGAWRLRDGRWSLLEAVGILETVQNRFNPDLANPLRIPGVADWPGCGHGGTFATCIDPAQYLGLASQRALSPRQAAGDEELLFGAVDRAVAAWFVFEEALLGEITAGATSFVHQCGGASYGQPSTACTGAGADPSRGPIVFRGPSFWLAGQGRYALETLGRIDYVEGAPPTRDRAYVAYLLRGAE
jgi:hypothetical protein